MTAKHPTIGVAIITKNAQAELQRLLPQLRLFDQVVVVDTGSTDGTRNYVKKLGKPYEWHSYEWREDPVDDDTNGWGFASARNFSFDKLRTEYALWLDSDDVIGHAVSDHERIKLTPKAAYEGFRKLVEDQPDTDFWQVDYIYGQDENGNANTFQKKDRLLNRKGDWVWVWPIHECPILTKPVSGVSGVVKDLQIIHMSNKPVGQSAERNMTYLRKWREQLERVDPKHFDLARCKMLIAFQYAGLGQPEESMKAFQEYLDDYPSSDPLERWMVHNYIAKQKLQGGLYEEAEKHYTEALLLQPDYMDSYYGLARCKFAQGEDPKKVLHLLEIGAKGKQPSGQVMSEPLDYSWHPLLLASDCHFKLGEIEPALRFAKAAFDLRPMDFESQRVMSQASKILRERDSKAAALSLFRHLNDHDENEKAAHLWESLPYIAQQDEEVRAAALKARERVRHVWDADEYEKFYQNNTGWAAVPDEYFEKNIIFGRGRFDYTLSRLIKALPKGGRILDVGSSDGIHSLHFAKAGFEVVGIDLDQRCVDEANRKAEKFGLPAKFIHGFFERMDYEKVQDPFDGVPLAKHFDAVICNEVIEHVQDVDVLLDALGECAKDGAPIIITTPNGAYEQGDIPAGETEGMTGHVRVFTQETFEASLKTNIEFHLTEAHFVPAEGSPKEGQGWQVGEIRRMPRPDGPIIRILLGPTIEPFSPDSLIKGGIGGSETAVVHMARHWSRLGCQVVVYGRSVGVWDGVFYRDWQDWKPDMKSNLFIGWRSTLGFAKERPNSDVTVLWMHDTNLGPDFTKEIGERIDHVAVLSEFHKDVMGKVHPHTKNKLWVTRNGIEPGRYAVPGEKVPHKYLYCSAPNRGLEHLLDIWPSVLKEIPDAQLNVAYGFDTSIKIEKMLGHSTGVKWHENLRRRVKNTPGVVYHDRLNQIQLAELQKTCEAWLYPPSDFEETYCIGALEIQAAGCVPVSRANGALPEVLQNSITWFDEVPNAGVLGTDDKKIAGTLKHLHRLLPPEQLEKNREWAMQQSWANLAIEWLQYLEPQDASEEEQQVLAEENAAEERPVLTVVN